MVKECKNSDSENCNKVNTLRGETTNLQLTWQVEVSSVMEARSFKQFMATI